MSMTVEARLNIGAVPAAALFRPGGVVFYRSTPTGLRKASFATLTDVLFANTMVGAGAEVAVEAGGFYCNSAAFNGGAGDGTANFVDMNSAAVTVVARPDPGGGNVAHGGMGVIYAGSIARVCMLASTGGAPRFQWEVIPPVGAMVQAASTSALSGTDVWTHNADDGSGRLVTFNGPGNVMYYSYFRVSPPANVAPTLMVVPLIDGIYTNSYISGGSGVPWRFLPYTLTGPTFMNHVFARGASGGVDYPLLYQINRGTGVATLQILDAVNAVPASNFVNNAWIDQEFGRIYWSFSSNLFRIYGAYLDQFPFALTDFVDVDANAGGNNVRGIYTEPPYVYVVKMAGAGFGNQYIRIFDTSLMHAARSRHRGGELWGIIPEVANYIG